MSIATARISLFLMAVSAGLSAGELETGRVAQQRAITYLAREVPAWSRENKCFSCHNNGDAARALYQARSLVSKLVTGQSLRETTRWLSEPIGWKNNGGEGPFNDRNLATVQFAHALVDATQAGVLENEDSLRHAAVLLTSRQSSDGYWNTGAGGLVGSPATYGRILGTVAALRAVRRADQGQLRDSVQKAEDWLRRQRPRTVMDAAALLIGLHESGGLEQEVELQSKCLRVIDRGEARGGGWGPFVTAAPEPFDTALVLMALTNLKPSQKRWEQILRGRQYLIDSQLDDGSWPETTRPANGESYAQRISTTAWAAMALMATLRESRQ